jgi:hypothetical protein
MPASRHATLGQAMYAGWLNHLLTHPVEGLDNYRLAYEKLETEREAIKAFYKVASF